MKRIILTLTLALFTLPILNAQDLPSYVPTEGLVAYYPFNGNANDASGNGHHGTVNGATLSSDRDGNENSSYSFDGVSSSISTVGNFNFNNELTFSSWIYIESYIEDGVHERIVNSSEGTGGISDRWMFNVSPNSESSTLEFNIGYTGNEVQGLKTIPLNKFTHVAFTFKNGEVVIYMDGEIDSSSTLGITNLNFINSPIDLGSVNGLESFFNGELDDIGIWNRALSEQEIQNLYNSSTGDIILNGVVSAENNQIKNVADPTDAQDVVTKNYTYSKTEVDALIANLQQQINEMNQTITSSELEGNWNVKELYYLNPDTNEITSTFPTPECSKPYQYYEFLASKEIFWTGIGTNWVTQSCTSNEFGVKQDPYTITTENISGDDPITYINFPGGSGTRNWEVISRPSENTIIIRAWQNNEITLYNNEVYGLKLVKESRIE